MAPRGLEALFTELPRRRCSRKLGFRCQVFPETQGPREQQKGPERRCPDPFAYRDLALPLRNAYHVFKGDAPIRVRNRDFVKVNAQFLCLLLGGCRGIRFLLSRLCYLPHQALYLLGCFSCYLLRLLGGSPRGLLGLWDRLAHHFFHTLFLCGLL